MKNKSGMRGVTLIELLTVVAIIGILGTIAMSSYRNSILRSHRAEAKIALMTIKVEQEKFFLQNRRYARSAEMTTDLHVNASTQRGYYTIALTTANTDTTYSATATAAGGQADDSACKAFTVTSAGNQTSTDSSNADSSSTCWK